MKFINSIKSLWASSPCVPPLPANHPLHPDTLKARHIVRTAQMRTKGSASILDAIRSLSPAERLALLDSAPPRNRELARFLSTQPR